MERNLKGSAIQAKERLMFALDVPTAKAAEAMLDRVQETVGVIKIGLELFTSEGPAVVRMVQRYGKPVFLDLKVLDIAETVQRTTARVADMGVSFLTVHAGRKALAAAVMGRAGHPEMNILAVTVLTNVEQADLRESGYDGTIEQAVVARARVATEEGCDGVIASGREPAAIRSAIAAPLLIVTPGVRPAGQGVDEHARATTPRQAIHAGADYLVVGRPIRDASDPRAAALEIVSEMQAAFAERS
ncbi:MAG: orotidine-5'-phosphate decarboxylase [Nitrospira sp. SB0672_bin_25]|nr:orotidine-5'-phosphate decarboxylase [Nitrospira sp. SB0666_bin_27]MYF25305.1 orotidine-5'-phosphate decarboxylase [Nitrospira sp. SB0678_bin_10]MYJ54759.1 orotidine-5'-phosphate decarboxylase [Nitrospira sp. SB0672_bin_25]